ncbi:MAG: DUF92 domain-containing protein [Candidatus Micrarchaeia archaeon]
MAIEVKDFLAGFVLSGFLSLFFQGGALTFGGKLAAVLLGTVIYGFAGFYWLLLVLAFFISSNFLSSYKLAHKSVISKDKFEKYGPRDFWQVLANGGVAAVLAAVQSAYPADWVFAAFIGVIAFVNADTWATELGVLGREKPRLITNWKPAEIGTSGAVSKQGSLAAVAGALFIGLVAIVAQPYFSSFSPASQLSVTWILLLSLAGGIVGSFADSLLGATVQAIRYCPACKKETERAVHSCGKKTRHLRGLEYVDNDTVNLIGSFAAAAVATALFLWL